MHSAAKTKTTSSSDTNTYPRELDRDESLALEDIRRRHVQKVLDLTGGDKERACEVLRVSKEYLESIIKDNLNLVSCL